MSKEQAYKQVTEALNQCTVEDSHHMAVVVVVDTHKDTVKVFGLNIEEQAVPLLLVEAAGEVGEKFFELKKRTLQ